MNSESGYFKLGLFVIIGTALLIAGVVILGAGAFFTEYVRVETATTAGVDGLDVGAAVKYMGVTVGKVAKIELAAWRYHDDDPEKQIMIQKYVIVDLDIRREELQAKTMTEIQTNLQRAVANGMRVRMASSGLTAPPNLEVVNLNPKQFPPPALPWTPPDMYVPSAPSTMSQIVEGVQTALGEVKEMNLPGLIKHADKLVQDANAAIVDLKTAQIRERALALLDETNQTVRRAKEILSKPEVDETMKHVSATMAQVEEIVKNPKLQKTLDHLNEITESAAPATQDLRRTVRDLSVMLASQQEDLESIILSLRRTMQNAASMMEDAKNNPSRMIFGEPPPHINKTGESK